MTRPSQKLYTTTGAVQELLVKILLQEKRPITFINALIRLGQSGSLTTTRPVAPYYTELLPDEVFVRELTKLPIDALQLTRNGEMEVIREDEIFPGDRDVFSFCFFHSQNDPPHDHDFFEMTYVYQGTCRLIFEEESRVLTAGDMAIVSPNSRHTNLIDPGSVAISLLIRSSTLISMFWSLLARHDLLSTFFRNSLRSAREANYLLFQTDNSPEIKLFIQRIVWECNLADDYANSFTVSLVSQLFITVLRRYGGSAMFFRVSDSMAENLDTALLTQYIQKNYQTVTLSSLASTFHYSEAYLSKVIQDSMGQKFTEIIRTLKLKHAVEYLTKSNLKINDIAELVGYSSTDHFTRVFKKKYGQTPQEFRKG